MLRHEKEARGYILNADDGEIGKVKELYFDDVLWVVRYLIADTGRWLPGRQVLISPASLHGVDEANKSIRVSLTKEQIRQSPPIELDRPVSRQGEVTIVNYYGWPTYWDAILQEQKEAKDPNLRSTKEVEGYKIETVGGAIGQVADFVFDDETWSLRYMVADTGNIIPGRKVLLALDWISNINPEEKKIAVDVSRDAIESAPHYGPQSELNRAIETDLYDHYRKKYYWG